MENQTYETRNDLQSQTYQTNVPAVVVQCNGNASSRMHGDARCQHIRNMRADMSRRICMRNVNYHLRR